MEKRQHRAVLLSNNSPKEKFIESLLDDSATGYFSHLNGQNGFLFSEIALNNFINEEVLHERFDVVTDKQKSLRFLSGGEQKKALLSYLLTQSPDFVVMDNPFDYLDIQSQAALALELADMAKYTTIVQLMSRKKDLQPFVTDVYSMNDDGEITPAGADFFENKPGQEVIFSGTIPAPTIAYNITGDRLVSFNKVSVSYEDKPIVTNISWHIKPGDFWQLTGPNGSGKSTILSLITGDNPKGYGQDLVLFGRKKGSGETVWEIKQKIGYFTNAMTDLFGKEHTLEQMIISGLYDSIGLYTKPSPLEIKLAAEWLQVIGLSVYKKLPFQKLSLGRQRMAMIARAMIKHPPLLILDEPTSGLDDHNVELLTTLINKIAAESTTAIIYVSHRAEPALSPNSVFELTPGKDGSTGKVISFN